MQPRTPVQRKTSYNKNNPAEAGLQTYILRVNQRLLNRGARRAALRLYFLGSYALKSLILLTFLRMIFCGHP